MLIDGTPIDAAMNAERIGLSDLRAAVRRHGSTAFKDVHVVVLETDGTLSVIAQPGDGSTLCDVVGYGQYRKQQNEP
ncbi:YetF domain-containing protein [Altererythrobacter sp. TH136]|uniref:YetF domain-containing protein n=1 Tax=Altererythrobacter sp. TH136 TaxID=2067415 RepID=UPI001AF0133F|nr:YetF domain-containing protein [Altererythrobacter sp. TH136]